MGAWSGAWLLAQSPLALAAVLAACAALRTVTCWWRGPLLMAAATAFSWLLRPEHEAWTPVGVAAVGAIAMLPDPGKRVAVALPVFAGALAGMAAEGPWSTPREMAAAGALVLVICGICTVVWRRLHAWQPVGTQRAAQALGAWVVTLGALMALLSIGKAAA